jgi:hypothetical protein
MPFFAGDVIGALSGAEKWSPPFWSHFITTKTDHFTKTGSGQAQEQSMKKERRFLQANRSTYRTATRSLPTFLPTRWAVTPSA